MMNVSWRVESGKGGGEIKRSCERHPSSQAPLMAPRASGVFCTCLEVSSPARTSLAEETATAPGVIVN